jgi:hypothetical protein
MSCRETFLLVSILVTTICSIFIYFALGVSFNNDFKCPTVISNTINNTTENTIMTTNSGGPSISISTDKIKYMKGEVIQVSGRVCDNKGTPGQERIRIQATLLANSSKVPSLPKELYWIYQIIGESPSLKPEIVYETSIFSINGSYTDNILNTQRSGTYNISATLANWNEIPSLTKVEVENPFTTSTAKILYIGIVSFVLLLILPGSLMKWRGLQDGVHITAKFNFLLISTIVLSVIFGFTLADVTLGPNSPVGLVLKQPLESEGQTTQGAEWVVNIGGHQSNNYADGINIPIYVVVFGIIGGYIRYLYDTATLYAERTEKGLKKIEKAIDSKKHNDFKYLEIKKSVIRQPVNLILRRDTNTESDKETELRKLAMYLETRKFFLYQALRDLALLVLSPLLAIAVWFLLVQVGVQGQQGEVQGQTGVFILATISFTVGLITDEVVQVLIRFTKERLGGVTESKKLIKPTLIKVAKNPVKNGDQQTLEVKASNKDSDIDDAIIKGTVTNQSGGSKGEFKGLTNDTGQFSYTWTIKDLKAGRYDVKLDISAKDHEDSSVTTTFDVIDNNS